MNTENPGEILKLSGDYWQTCALHAGVALGVFTPLSSSELSAKDLASQLGCDARALSMLLGALAALGLLKKEGDCFALTPPSRKYLSAASPDYLGFIIKHHHHLMASWARLPEAVRQGKSQHAAGGVHEDEREDFLLGMYNLAMGIAPGLAATLDLEDRDNLLDLGGGPGTYAIQFCLANPELKATVFDLPSTQPFARKTIDRFGMGQQVEFVSGDYHSDLLPDGYDVAWLSHILHAESPASCAEILAKAVEALVPGGILYVHEFILNDNLDGPLFPTLFSLNMLLGTPGGQAYSDAELRAMLHAAGLEDLGRLNFQGPNDSGIIYGHKP